MSRAGLCSANGIGSGRSLTPRSMPARKLLGVLLSTSETRVKPRNSSAANTAEGGRCNRSFGEKTELGIP